MLVNGEQARYILKDGYAKLDGLHNGDTVTVELDMQPRRVYPHPDIAADSGRVALMRGPLVYCAEGIDNPGGVLGLSADRNSPVETLLAERIGGMPKLRIMGSRAAPDKALYSSQPPKGADCAITLIPYFAWANRGVSDMRCFLPEKE